MLHYSWGNEACDCSMAKDAQTIDLYTFQGRPVLITKVSHSWHLNTYDSTVLRMRRLRMAKKFAQFFSVFCLIVSSVLIVIVILKSRGDFARPSSFVMEMNTRTVPLRVEEGPIISKCSKKSDARGYHQRVAAFSMYGDLSDIETLERYVFPLIQTARDFPSKYPSTVHSKFKRFK